MCTIYSSSLRAFRSGKRIILENYVIYQHLSLMESAAAVVSRDLYTSITTWKIMEDKADKRTIYPSHRPRLLYESPVPSRAAMSGGSDRAPISLANCLYYVRHRLVSGRPRRLPHQPRWLHTDNLICGHLMRQRWELSRPVRGGIHQVSGWKTEVASGRVMCCVMTGSDTRGPWDVFMDMKRNIGIIIDWRQCF